MSFKRDEPQVISGQRAPALNTESRVEMMRRRIMRIDIEKRIPGDLGEGAFIVQPLASQGEGGLSRLCDREEALNAALTRAICSH